MLSFQKTKKKLQATLDDLYNTDTEFTEYFIQHLSYILRLNHITQETIEGLIPPTKYNYDLFEDIPKKEVNENTLVKDLVKLYVYSFNRQLSDKRLKKATKKNIQDKKTEFTNNMEAINTLIKYGSTQGLQENEEPYGVQELIDNILNDPYTIEERIRYLIQSGYNQLNTRYYQQQLMKLFKQKYELFVVDEKTRNGKYESKYYYVPITYKNGFMTEANTIREPFKEINRQWLLDEINEEIYLIGLGFTNNDVFITLNDCQHMLEYINNSRRFNKQYMELENVFIHKPTMEIKTKPYDVVTLDRLGLIENEDTKDETIKLFKYDPNITLDNLTPDKMTPTLEILHEILVPRQDPTDKKILLFFLQVIGLMVHGNNDVKILPVFYREGNNGKGVLSNILKLLFGNQGASDIKQDRIDDNFINEVVDGTNHVIINDELAPDTISKNPSIYKQLSGASGMGGRQIFSNETRNIKEIPPLFLASNYIPEIEITADNKALIKRLILIRMPNIFVDKDEIDETRNEYEEKTGIDQIIANDHEGLSQLISLAINEFKKLDYTTNVRSQMAITPTIQETMYKLSSDNPLINYIGAYTKPLIQDTPKHEWITTSMIKEAFIDWYKRNNKGLEPPEDLFGNRNTRIGGALETIYGKDNVIKEKLPNEATKYCYKILTDNDKDIVTKQLIEIHELDPSNEYHASISKDTQVIYNIIKSHELTNERDIIQQLQQMGYSTKDINDYLIELDRVDLIEYKTQTTL